ncbi:MAG TPA: cob(I)yrinic acid a,c-diamide adenosyltransferase [Deltaproteobacteria bacterium]|nr:cob(I)yrinic acid a,c-diamide adenosyltransferase [Deltaproteobacteria bacterium]HPJ94623.1 cob(I)yrinic acid a,c-diamide adenosyltransferase [Deltaproteobacteria bacterium]HPR52772.1 cob(I)yrinic acid a,c-diamide adenosyltransferase [Deltaproteobacteria bacterium]
MNIKTSQLGKGYVHVYTGNGKGKTTAALGLALRAAGSGLATRIVQFMKGRHYSELNTIAKLEGLVKIEQFGNKEFCRISDPPDARDVEMAVKALERVWGLMQENTCDILIADEMITAGLFKLITQNDILDTIRRKPDGMELILTGRGASQGIIEAADLVTEMKEVKHYYTRGVQAREGIEH